jgi:arginase
LTDVGRPGPKLDPADVVIVGLRELDAAERDRLQGSGISIYTMRDIDERGMATVAHEALERLQHRHHLHISLDIDSIDPQEAPGAGTLVPGGITYREAQLLMEIIADRGGPDSLDIVEINPIIDVANRTARLAVDLAASLFGKRIL